MPALIIDVGHHIVDPDATGQVIQISASSSLTKGDPAVAGFRLRAQLGSGVPSDSVPTFVSVNFSTDIWSRSAHLDIGQPLNTNPHLASGEVKFLTDYETSANGAVVQLSVSTLGIPSGSFPLSLAGTQIGSSFFVDADGNQLPTIIINGTVQVRSIWQNEENSLDVNGDGDVSPIDILRLINYLNKHGSQELPLPGTGEGPPPYLDVNGDGAVAPNDALLVVNCINGGLCELAPMPIAATPITPADEPGPGPGNGENPEGPPVDPYTDYCLAHEDDPYCDNYLQEHYKGEFGPASPSTDNGEEDIPVLGDELSAGTIVGPSQMSGLQSAPAASLADEALAEYNGDSTEDALIEDLIEMGLDLDLLASTS